MRLEVKRALAPADRADVMELLDAATRADGHRPLADHLWLDLVDGGRPGYAGVVAWEDGHEHPIAYAQLSRGNASWALEVVVHPHHRYDAPLIGPELVAAAVDVVRGDGGGHVHWWVFEPSAFHVEVAASVGLRPGRRLFQMRCPLPTTGVARVTTRPFVPGTDDEAWLRVNNRAFADHPEQGDWDIDTLRLRAKEPWFDPEGFLLHEVDGRLAAFCWTKIHADADPPLGEIYVIAVDPDFHGRGLGRELTLAGLASLHARGIDVGMLYVDADNTAAVNLYRSLGFTVHRTDGAFVGDVAGTTTGP